MNAIEFVKKHGWGDAKICLLNCASPEDKWFMRRGDLISGQDFDDLKQIVDAWELIESLGGMDMAKDIFDIEINEPHYNYDAVKVTRIEKAINLVEQCQ